MSDKGKCCHREPGAPEAADRRKARQIIKGLGPKEAAWEVIQKKSRELYKEGLLFFFFFFGMRLLKNKRILLLFMQIKKEEKVFPYEETLFERSRVIQNDTKWMKISISIYPSIIHPRHHSLPPATTLRCRLCAWHSCRLYRIQTRRVPCLRVLLMYN